LYVSEREGEKDGQVGRPRPQKGSGQKSSLGSSEIEREKSFRGIYTEKEHVNFWCPRPPSAMLKLHHTPSFYFKQTSCPNLMGRPINKAFFSGLLSYPEISITSSTYAGYM